MVLDATRLIRDVIVSAFNGHDRIIAADRLSVAQALGAGGVVLTTYGAHGARTLNERFRQRHERKRGRKNIAAKIRIQPRDENGFAATHGIVEKRNDICGKKLELIKADDIVRIKVRGQCLEVSGWNRYAVKIESGAGAHHVAARIG